MSTPSVSMQAVYARRSREGFPITAFKLRSSNGIKVFRAKVVPVTSELFEHYGFAPQWFRAGLRIYYLTTADWERLCQELDDPKQMCGFYMLDRPDFQDRLFDNGQLTPRLAHINPHQRIVYLPNDADRATVVHEIAHDLFIGGAVSIESRDAFVRTVMETSRLARRCATPEAAADCEFFKTVAENYGQLYCEAGETFEGPTDWGMFAGECFAYAAEILLCPKESEYAVEIKVPRAIRVFFEGALGSPVFKQPSSSLPLLRRIDSFLANYL